MNEFYEEGKEQLDKLNEDVAQMKKRFENLCAYFGEDPAKADPVSQVFKFGEVFKQHVFENATAQAAKEQAAKKALAASQMKKRISVGQRKGPKGKGKVEGKEGAALGKQAAKVSAKHLDKRRQAGAKRVTDRMTRLKGKTIGRKNSTVKAPAEEAPPGDQAT
jgi:hypothetical protein